MPLYTYVVHWGGEVGVCQARRSNPWGFGDWTGALPSSAKGLAARISNGDLYGPADEVNNLQRTWRKVVRIDGADLVVVAVETKG